MKKIISLWKNKSGVLGIIALWIPFYAFLGWFGKGFFYYPLWSVLSGKYWKWLDEIFWASFPRMSAGFALDQPTVGKYFFWYAVLSFFALIFAVFIRILTDMQKKPNRRAYLIFYVIAFLFVMSVMLMPATLLAHYIIDLGITPTRFKGIIFLVMSIVVWPVLGWLFLHIKKSQKQKE